jgi:hypothetical protein
MIHILFLIICTYQSRLGMLTGENHWILVLICVNFLAPMAYVEYHSYWLEFNGAWIVLPWCNLTFNSLEFHNYSGFVENVDLIWLTGFLWILLGLLLIPTLKRSLDQSKWLFALASCFIVLATQVLIVTYGYPLAARPDVFTEIYALPISSLFSIAVVVARLSRSYISRAD